MNTDVTMNPQWITGFIDGEGSFQLSITYRSKFRYGIEVGLCFSVAQSKKSAYIIDTFQTYFGCGYVVNDNKSNCRVFRVKKLDDLRRTIIPFFQKYPLLTAKKEDFSKFVEIHHLLTNGEMNNKEGLKRIIQIGYSMNTRGTGRKKTLQQVLHHIDTM